MDSVSDEHVWELRGKCSQSIVSFVRERLSRQRLQQGAPQEQISEAQSIFDPQCLTMGFARRFATYKRPNLLLHDPGRLARMLTDRRHPVQLILAGKAHPQDGEGQAMIKQWNDFIARPDVSARVVFLADYDLDLTSHLVQGVDLWLNTPRRPWEASGTSGMKVLVNGGLNLSELDGWWAEAYAPELGWAIGDGQEHGDDPSWDAHEANELYDVLEKEVIPTFYNRDQRGIPSAWLKMMRASMVQLTPRFSSNRAVREYVEKYYLPAAAAYRCRTENESLLGVKLTNWSKSIAEQWSNVRFGPVTICEKDTEHVFEVPVFPAKLDPADMEVQLYAEPRAGGTVFRQKMNPVKPNQGSLSDYLVYTASVPATRPASDYTPRVIPYHRDASVPLEAAQILWAH